MFDGVRHYPIGLLHDLFMYTDENTRRTPLPWRINIRLTNFPTDKLLRSPSVEAAQDAFMSMIKEVKPYAFSLFTPRLLLQVLTRDVGRFSSIWINKASNEPFQEGSIPALGVFNQRYQAAHGDNTNDLI